MASRDTEIRRIIAKLGYEFERDDGKGHQQYVHPSGARLAVPKTMGRGRGFANCVAKAKRNIRLAITQTPSEAVAQPSKVTSLPSRLKPSQGRTERSA